jgi:5-methylcytosine-specific restriction endonuclease McrA
MRFATCCPDKEYVAKGLCKTCYRREHKRKMREDPEKRRYLYDITAAWHKRNPEHERERSKRRRSENPEYHKALSKAWMNAHPEKRREYKLRYRLRHREQYLIQMRAAVKKRKALKKGALISDFTGSQWKTMKELCNFCIYCGSDSTKLTQDHLTPLSHGGAHTEANIAPACISCNAKKGTMTLEEYHVATTS